MVVRQSYERRERVRSRTRAVEMPNLRGLLGKRRMDRIRNAQMEELCVVKGGVGERKVFSSSSAMWRGWRMIRLLRESM